MIDHICLLSQRKVDIFVSISDHIFLLFWFTTPHIFIVYSEFCFFFYGYLVLHFGTKAV